MNSLFTSFIYFLSRKLNVAPVIIQSVLTLICIFISGDGINEFTITGSMIFLPVMMYISYLVAGRSWFQKQKK